MHVIGTPLSHIKSKLDKKSENIYQVATYNNTVEIYFLFNIFLKNPTDLYFILLSFGCIVQHVGS